MKSTTVPTRAVCAVILFGLLITSTGCQPRSDDLSKMESTEPLVTVSPEPSIIDSTEALIMASPEPSSRPADDMPVDTETIRSLISSFMYETDMARVNRDLEILHAMTAKNENTEIYLGRVRLLLAIDEYESSSIHDVSMPDVSELYAENLGRGIVWVTCSVRRAFYHDNHSDMSASRQSFQFIISFEDGKPLFLRITGMKDSQGLEDFRDRVNA